MSTLEDIPAGKDAEERSVGCLGRNCRPMYGFRFVILVLTNLCLTSICSNMIAFNFTMICMTREETVDVGNGTQTTAYVPYTQDEKSILIWAVSFGSIFATFPFSWLYTKYGAHLVFLAAGVISVLSTALIPLSADLGMVAFVAVRVLQGVSFAANFAAIGMVCSRWASLTENGFFLSCMTNFSQIAVIITNPISAWLCESSLGWQAVYYVHAAVGPVLWLVWYFVYSDYPDRHKCLGKREVEKIQEGKSKSHLEIHGFMPYKALCSNTIVLTIWFNALADIVSAIFLLTYLPTYIHKVLRYDLQTTGFYSSLPALTHAVLKVICGYVFDEIRCISEVNKMRICNCIALCGSAFFFAVVGFVPDDWPFLAVIFLTLNYSCVATNCGGFYKCGTLIARQYSHFVIANIQFLKCFTLFLSPLLVSIFVHDEGSKADWRVIFLIMAVILCIANALFCYVVTDQPAEFTKITKESYKARKEQKKLALNSVD